MKGTPEKIVISKSPTDKPQAVVEPLEKSMGREGSSDSNQSVSVQPPPAEIRGEQNGLVI